MRAIFARELKSYFITMTGWTFIAFVLVFVGIFMMVYNLNYGYGNFEYVLSSMTFVYLIAVPLLTMRCFADERRQHTDMLLYSLPLSSAQIVVGKYLAMLVVLSIPLAVSCTYPLILSMFGTIYAPTAYVCIFAFFLMGAALTAIGMFASSLCESQVTAAVVCFIFLLVDYFLPSLASYVPSGATAACVVFTVLIVVCAGLLALLTKNGFLSVGVALLAEAALILVAFFNNALLDGVVNDFLTTISLFSRFSTFVNGVFDVTAVVLYVAVCVVFAVLAAHSFEKRRWS